MTVANPITDAELEGLGAMLQSVVALSMLIDVDLVERAVASLSMSHSVMPILDPTAYRRDMRSLELLETNLRLFATFRRGLERMKADIERNGMPAAPAGRR